MINSLNKHWVTGPAVALALFLGLASSPSAWAGEADDLQDFIDLLRRNVTDLQRIDDHKVAVEEVAILSTWLDEAWRLRAEKQFDTVRRVLDRCQSQADMIREQITAGQLALQARQEEAGLDAARKHVDELKQSIAAAKQKKAVLEGASK